MWLFFLSQQSIIPLSLSRETWYSWHRLSILESINSWSQYAQIYFQTDLGGERSRRLRFLKYVNLLKYSKILNYMINKVNIPSFNFSNWNDKIWFKYIMEELDVDKYHIIILCQRVSSYYLESQELDYLSKQIDNSETLVSEITYDKLDDFRLSKIYQVKFDIDLISYCLSIMNSHC